MLSKFSPSFFLLIILLVLIKIHYSKDQNFPITSSNINNIDLVKNSKLKSILIDKPITIGNYFQFLDSMIEKYDSLTPYKLSEHLLVRANPWIIDTLKNTDYYIMKSRGSFIYNQKNMTVLKKGDSINLPDTGIAEKILKSFNNTYIDINIPEYKLRIIEDSTVLYKFPIRVGQPKKKFLKMANRIIDLKTKTGSGYIVKYVKNPDFYNPVNGHQYFVTTRDDNKVTAMPQIPFIETEIDGVRNGQLIHPTTNPITLEKAYSNGCIGTKEADAWIIYYYAPIGTKIKIRYDLTVIDSSGKKVALEDIYGQYLNR